MHVDELVSFVRAMGHRILMASILLISATASEAQTAEATIQVVPQSTSVRIERTAAPQLSWSFADSYAGVLGLGKRIRNFEALDTAGRLLPVRTVAPGQFESSAPTTRIRYEVDLSPPARASDAAFVSWLTQDHGILRVTDLLPLAPLESPRRPEDEPLAVRLHVPAGWFHYSDEEVTALGTLRFVDLAGGVIVVGKNVQRSARADSGTLVKVLSEGDWPSSGDDALDTVATIIKLHSEVGAVPCRQVTLALMTFPGMAPTNWSAETRRCTVTLLMGRVPSKTAALAQLGNALTHELFHLWVPNGVTLTGDYDWFFEGFTMYQAARAAVRLGYVSFPEFLSAIARAYDGSSVTPDTQRLSLVEASKQRWTIGASAVYSKAMVVAFIYDLNLRYQSKGKRSLDDVYRRLFNDRLRNRSPASTEIDGNAAAIKALRDELPANDFIERFVNGSAAIDLQREIAPFGFRTEKLVRTHVSVDDHLTGRQRDLLKQLGYNEPRNRR